MDANQIENHSRMAFSKLREVRVDPPPFMKARILAHLEVEQKSRKELWFWRALSGVALSTCAVFAFVHFAVRSGEMSANEPRFFAMQPYVIHVDIGEASVVGGEIAEIELPSDVHFVSKAHPEVSDLRTMRLSISDPLEGRSRLPFVVSADHAGHRELKVRIIDANSNVIHEQIVAVNFLEKKS